MESPKKKRKNKSMELLRVVIEYDAKKDMDIGRQTTFVKKSDLNKKVQIKLRGKKVKAISVEIINLNKAL
jgi:hypothetical protein